MKEYRLYRAYEAQLSPKTHYNPSGDNYPYYATLEEAHEIVKTHRAVSTFPTDKIFLDFNDCRERQLYENGRVIINTSHLKETP